MYACVCVYVCIYMSSMCVCACMYIFLFIVCYLKYVYFCLRDSFLLILSQMHLLSTMLIELLGFDLRSVLSQFLPVYLLFFLWPGGTYLSSQVVTGSHKLSSGSITQSVYIISFRSSNFLILLIHLRFVCMCVLFFSINRDGDYEYHVVNICSNVQVTNS